MTLLSPSSHVVHSLIIIKLNFLLYQVVHNMRVLQEQDLVQVPCPLLSPASVTMTRARVSVIQPRQHSEMTRGRV